MTWVLFVIWAALIGFAFTSLFNPDWLSALAAGGEKSEAYAYKHYGDTELRNGNYAKAASQYAYALKILPDRADFHANLGVAYLRLGELRAAREELLRARALETTQGLERSISFNLGEIAEREKQPDEAIRYYLEALSNGARPDGVYKKLGTIYLAQQDFPRALEAFQQVLSAQTDPNLPYREMIRRIDEGIADEETEAQRWMKAGGAQTLSEDDWRRYDRATLDRMYAGDPEIAKTHNHLGFIHYRMGNTEQAIRHFETSLQIWPNNQDASRNLQILRGQG